MDSKLDIERDKYLQWKEQQKIAMQEACKECKERKDCIYYDAEEEEWDYEQCFKDW